MKKSEKIDALKKLRAYVRSKRFGGMGSLGLCSSIWDFNYGKWVLTLDQKTYLRKLIPKHKEGDYVWKCGAKAPRIKFINEKLKKLEEKK